MRFEPTPLLLAPNQVWRSYVGGQVLRQFRSLPEAGDNHYPEDWLASTVQARNGSHATHAEEGLSPVIIDGKSRFLPELLAEDPGFWFGNSHDGGSASKNLGVLWKLLDSSVRLQIQAHPDAAFARQHLNSKAGKTECWYILSTRGNGYVYLGFQNPPTREAWAGMIREQRVEDMCGCFERIPVKAGDCYVVPAGTPHAIGAGVFLVELMEPTDWVVRCETVNAGLALPPEACFMGLGLEACLDVFDFTRYSLTDVRGTFQQQPTRLKTDETFVEEEIIGAPWHRFFRLHRVRGTSTATWSGNELLLAIILKGSGSLAGEYHRRLGNRSGSKCHNSRTDPYGVSQCRAGQSWLLPGAMAEWDWKGDGQEWEILLLKLPRP